MAMAKPDLAVANAKLSQRFGFPAIYKYQR